MARQLQNAGHARHVRPERKPQENYYAARPRIAKAIDVVQKHVTGPADAPLHQAPHHGSRRPPLNAKNLRVGIR